MSTVGHTMLKQGWDGQLSAASDRTAPEWDGGPMTPEEIAAVLQPFERSTPVRAAIEVSDRNEADRIKVALDDPIPRALVNVIGALTPLSPKAQQRVIAFVVQHFDEIEP